MLRYILHIIKRQASHSNFVVLLITALAVVAFFSPLTYAGQQNSTQPLVRYNLAKQFFQALKQTPSQNQKRNKWLQGVRKFRRIYMANRTSDLAPSCLLMMGRMYNHMFIQFGRPLDLNESQDYFNKVVSLFPHNRLADDALFDLAQITIKTKRNPVKAAAYYKKIIQLYPDGDKKKAAFLQLKKLAKQEDLSLPTDLSQSTQKKADLVDILPVQYWSSKDYTRIVIRASGQLQYTSRLLEKYNNKPRQLFINLKKSKLPSQYNSPIPLKDGLLKQIRIEPYGRETVRIVLDIESVADYKMFSLKDPFRLIIDIRGSQEQGETTPVNLEKKPHILTPVKHTQPPPKAPPVPGPVMKHIDNSYYVTLEDRKKYKPANEESRYRSSTKTNRIRLSLAQQLGLGVRRIVIDPGHGGKDPGAMAFSLKEKDITLAVAQKTAALLRDQYGLEVLLTRNTDRYLSLEERTAIANTKNADLFVSIHVNANKKKSAKGVETFFLNLSTNNEAMLVAARENATSTHNISELQDILADLMQNEKISESSHLAKFVQTSLFSGLTKKNYKTRNLGVKQAPFYVLIGAEMPAVLAEISFITNPEEAKLLKNMTYLHCIAQQIAAGIDSYVSDRKSVALSH